MTNEEAIKEIQRWLNGCPYADTKEAFNLAIKALEEQPQVTVFCENADKKTTEELKTELERVNNELRPQGEWIVYDYDGVIKFCKCSLCGRTEEIISFKNYPYCHCGAKMKEGDSDVK